MLKKENSCRNPISRNKKMNRNVLIEVCDRFQLQKTFVLNELRSLVPIHSVSTIF